jgi:uncharacterized protein
MPLLLDLTQIRGPRDRVDRVYQGSALAVADDFTVCSDVSLTGEVEKTDRVVRLVGTVRATLALPCSRCLEPMTLPVDAAFDLRYLPAALNTGDEDREVGDEDLGVAFYQGEQIDLGQLIREQFYLALPMKPLCRPDCLGLCPECGTNLNVAQCGCEHRWVDPRMAALGQLLPKPPAEH